MADTNTKRTPKKNHDPDTLRIWLALSEPVAKDGAWTVLAETSVEKNREVRSNIPITFYLDGIEVATDKPLQTDKNGRVSTTIAIASPGTHRIVAQATGKAYSESATVTIKSTDEPKPLLDVLMIGQNGDYTFLCTVLKNGSVPVPDAEIGVVIRETGEVGSIHTDKLGHAEYKLTFSTDRTRNVLFVVSGFQPVWKLAYRGEK